MSLPIDHWRTDSIVCPHCGHKHEDDGDGWGPNNSTEMECSACSKPFFVERDFSVEYTTAKLQPKSP